MIGGDGINDESNKTAPAPTQNTYLTKYTCFRLVRLNRNGMPFAFRDPDVDAVVKRTLDHHRGPSEAHMRRCCEWTVYMLAEHPHPMSFVTSEHWKPTRKGTIEYDGPAPGTMTAVQLPTNGVNAYESGFGVRTGWAGRSH